jgi:hypothetical protein
MPNLQALASKFMLLWPWAPRPVQPVPAPPRRPRKDLTIVTDEILRRYADDHKSGIKRLMAIELLAARAREAGSGDLTEHAPDGGAQQQRSLYRVPLTERSNTHDDESESN